MKFVTLLPGRDEADIMAQCINGLLRWADEIFILDTGSIAETGEILQDFAVRKMRIKLVGPKPVSSAI